jgi:hypothetical protein
MRIGIFKTRSPSGARSRSKTLTMNPFAAATRARLDRSRATSGRHWPESEQRI